ncbi:hypothetical protein CAPTEDRAFT_227570 [Capitella teleta]|uniref:Uncharacterized protein n=1 Tax=Capitella teleta TaxID=283909 RepID=R7TI30_CAPTE|nr:hypothetical protein CAPTEDRAFT_227570 [Capitella teleta]|eukprot:ELT93369.1 hypothetical protein CAPTEDRAFT_227570 [Capitella teleta]
MRLWIFSFAKGNDILDNQGRGVSVPALVHVSSKVKHLSICSYYFWCFSTCLSNILEGKYGAWEKCIESGGKCYSTHECCGGFVCAVFNDYFADKEESDDENPEVPGTCVKEKDLTECSSSLDCPMSYKCLTLSRSGDRYCIKRQRSMPVYPKSGSNRKYDFSSAKGGLGSDCEDDDDCKQYVSDGSSKLCCQAVNRGRQGTRKMCDRIRPISHCIGKK